MEKEAKNLVKDIRNRLQLAESVGDTIKWLKITRALLIPQNQHYCLTPTEIQNTGYECAVFRCAQTLVQHKLMYELVISKFSIDWVSALTTEHFSSLVKPIFFDGSLKDSFLVLMKSVTEAQLKDFRFHKCVSLLEEFLTCQRLCQLLQIFSRVDERARTSTALDIDEELVITSLVSLPEKLANRLQHDNRQCSYPHQFFDWSSSSKSLNESIHTVSEDLQITLLNSDTFLTKNYIPMLAHSVVDTLHWAHDLLSRGQDVSLLFVSVLVGRLCVTGGADLLLDTVLPQMCVKVRSDFIWCRICERVFVGVPARNLEAVLVPLFRKISWYGLIDKFLGDSIVHNTSIKMLVCTKLLLHRHYSKSKLLLQNIIGYLSGFHTRRHLLMEVMMSLLQVWGDSSAMKHISTEQHLYISQALMICIGVMTEAEKKKFKDQLLRLLMPGVQAHLENSDQKMRTVGMTVAKTLTHTVDPSGPQLEFELDSGDPVVADLLSYTELPKDPGPTGAEKAISAAEKEKGNQADIERKMNSIKLEEKTESQTNVDSGLDSDDDLVPYDMSNDKKINKAKPPKYIRDCMEGLICSSDDPEKTDLCLQHAEALIRKKTDGLDEIAAEFAKILLHMQDTHSFDNFLANRFAALVALTVMCPSQIADYLTSQFYERNYSIRQRMDILEVLANAAQELSEPTKPERPQEKHRPKISEITPESEPSSWRDIVQRRIESNTRRFAHGRTRPEPEPTLNRFLPVAGQFFYPLMVKVDKSEPCLDLLGKDNTLLFRLLYTLSIILMASVNILTAPQMGRTLLQFTWPIRLHPDPAVRQACLIATSSVFLVVPAFSLMSDLHSDVTETRAWLEDVIEQDADTECQKMAAQALLLLQDRIKKEMESSMANTQDKQKISIVS